MHPRKDPPPQARPAPLKSEPKQESWAKVPHFGAWENGGEGGYTQSFENFRKNNKNGCTTVTPESSSDAPRDAKEGRSKVPQFDDWNEGENGAYADCFENALKTKTAGRVPVPDPVEPQLNRDVNHRARPSPSVGTKIKADNPRNASRGSNSSDTPQRIGKQNAGVIHLFPQRGTAIPAWGVWHSDPQQAEGFTGAFTRAKEEKNTPLNSNMPQCYNQQHRRSTERKVNIA